MASPRGIALTLTVPVLMGAVTAAITLRRPHAATAGTPGALQAASCGVAVTPTRALLVPSSAHVRGNPKASATIVAFLDSRSPGSTAAETALDSLINARKGQASAVVHDLCAEEQLASSIGVTAAPTYYLIDRKDRLSRYTDLSQVQRGLDKLNMCRTPGATQSGSSK